MCYRFAISVLLDEAQPNTLQIYISTAAGQTWESDMDLISQAIFKALAAGVTSATIDAAKKPVVSAYVGLKNLIGNRFGGDSAVVEAVERLEQHPDSEGQRLVVQEELKAARAYEVPALLEAAKDLLDSIQALPGGGPSIQIARGTGIAQADRGSTATVKITGGES